MEMALDNARESLRQNLKTDSGRELTLLSLKSELRLKKIPKRIEAFDISNTGGHDACGSMVSFELCQPDKSGYRHFNIRTVPEANDFAMMEEVVTRRYKRLMEEGEEWPDLIMVDGGKRTALGRSGGASGYRRGRGRTRHRGACEGKGEGA